ncbi:hypothetical protein QM012_008717 [Aureobasidium pullulans]|uniref:Uncharacterized protein n=1 Tax=Aureobasidium pullulans TaxID=5580 RepID=A0ABR0THP6_AURPU
MAAFLVLALTLLGFSALKQSRHNPTSHNQQHHAQVDAWITRMRRKTWTNTHIDRDVEMQVLPELPRRPDSAHVRSGPFRVSRMGRLNFACGQRNVTPAGFF